MKQLLAHLKGLKKKNVVNTKPYMIRIVHITKQPKGAGRAQQNIMFSTQFQPDVAQPKLDSVAKTSPSTNKLKLGLVKTAWH